MTSESDTVAVIGIGAMGHGMASSTLHAGIPTIVWNRNPEATRDLADLGADVADSAADAAGQPPIVVTMLTDADAVISVARDQGMLAALAPGLDTETLVGSLGGGPLVSPWQAAKLERIAIGEFSVQFALSLALKDVRLALQAAGDERFNALACLADEWQQVVDDGYGDQDITVVTPFLERLRDAP